jgi:TolB-like protein/Flp pilus assembly protein TadD
MVLELRRRRVLRVAGAYAAMAFIVAQVADIAFPALNLPAWSLTLVIVLLLVGFPFALIFSWIFDVTPEGLRRTEADARSAGGSTTSLESATSSFRPPRAAAIAAVGAVIILALAAGAFMLQDRPAAADKAADDEERELAIAVLPFTNQSSDPDSEYFSDGLTEAIQLRLNRLGTLRVTSITSTMTYRGSSKRMQEIAAELGVDHVVEGSVRRVGDQVRVSARLVEAATDRTLWSETLDRPFSDLLAIETEIAEQVAAGLRLRLTASQRDRLASSGTSSVAAYDLYMKARKILRETLTADWASGRSTFYSVVSLLRQALDADPEYASAWAELSTLYLYHVDLPKAAREDSSLIMAQRAIRFGPELPDGYVALGRRLRITQAGYAEARRQYELALERDPNNVRALLAMGDLAWNELRLEEHARLAYRAARLEPTNEEPLWNLFHVLYSLGDYEGALAWGRRAMQVDPAPGDMQWRWEAHQSAAHLRAGNRTAAERHLKRFMELAPDAPAAWFRAAGLLSELGDYASALPWAERYATSVAGLPDVDGIPAEAKVGAWYVLGFTLAAAGDTMRGHDYLSRAEQGILAFRALHCPGNNCRNTGLARIYAFRGDADRAVDYLRHSIRVGWIDEYPGSSVVQRPFANISGDPRYRRIMSDLVADFDRQREALRREGINRP